MPEEPPVREIHVEIHQALRAMTEKLVAVGWEAVGNLSKIAANSEAFKITLAPTYPRTKPGAVAVIAMFALFGVATHSAWATGDTYTRIAETAKVGAAGVVPACQGRLFESLSESGNVHGGEEFALSNLCNIPSNGRLGFGVGYGMLRSFRLGRIQMFKNPPCPTVYCALRLVR